MKKTPAVPSSTLKLTSKLIQKITDQPFALLEGVRNANAVTSAILDIHDYVGIDVTPYLLSQGVEMFTNLIKADPAAQVDPPAADPAAADPAPAKRTMSAAGRRAISKAQKARWKTAGKKAAATRAANKAAR